MLCHATALTRRSTKGATIHPSNNLSNNYLYPLLPHLRTVWPPRSALAAVLVPQPQPQPDFYEVPQTHEQHHCCDHHLSQRGGHAQRTPCLHRPRSSSRQRLLLRGLATITKLRSTLQIFCQFQNVKTSHTCICRFV